VNDDPFQTTPGPRAGEDTACADVVRPVLRGPRLPFSRLRAAALPPTHRSLS